jgi:glucan phosphoethanolaminetransferase (alkaline phosphatase superfamily)
MIQRLQSVWLLLAAAAAFCSLQFSFYSGNMIAANQAKSFAVLNAQSNLLLLILSAGAGIASLISIFLYKNRKTQLRIVLVTLLVSILNLVLFFMQTKKFVPGEGNYNLTAIFAIIVPIFLILAMRGIRKDEKLVKSLDRLR